MNVPLNIKLSYCFSKLFVGIPQGQNKIKISKTNLNQNQQATLHINNKPQAFDTRK